MFGLTGCQTAELEMGVGNYTYVPDFATDSNTRSYGIARAPGRQQLAKFASAYRPGDPHPRAYGKRLTRNDLS